MLSYDRCDRKSASAQDNSERIKNESRAKAAGLKESISIEASRREYSNKDYALRLFWTATATATVAPTMGLLPMPRKPIISTCAGTDEEPAN